MSLRPFVASAVRPAPGALAALEDAARRRADARVVFAAVTGPDGSPDPAFEPWPELFTKERAIAAVADHLLAVRAAHPLCVLVHEEVVAVHGPPPTGPYGAGLRWSAVVLRDGGGLLVPEAAVEAPAGAHPSHAEALRSAAGLAALPGLTPQERLWRAFLLLRRPAAGRP